MDKTVVLAFTYTLVVLSFNMLGLKNDVKLTHMVSVNRHRRKFFLIMSLLIVFPFIITGCEKKELSSLTTQKNYYENTTITKVEPVSYGQTAQECFERGKSLFDPFLPNGIRENGDKAIEAYSQAINYEPDNAQFYYYRGWAYYTKIPVERRNATPDLTKAILLDPDYGDAYAKRGWIYLDELREYHKAIDDFTEALRLSPKTDSAYFDRQIIPTNINKYKANIYNNRGEAYRNINDKYQAIADYSEAIRLFPEHEGYLLHRSDLYWSINFYEKSIADLTTVLTLVPNNWEALTNRAIRYNTLGDRNRAIEDYAAMIRLKSDYFIRGLEDLKEEARAKAQGH